MDGVKYELNDIIVLHKKNDSDWRRFVRQIFFIIFILLLVRPGF